MKLYLATIAIKRAAKWRMLTTDCTSHIFNALPFKVYRNGDRSGAAGQVLGLGAVGGATDYGRMQKYAATHTDEEIIEQIRGEYNDGASSRQAISFLDKSGNFGFEYAITIGGNSYSVIPRFNSLYTKVNA